MTEETLKKHGGKILTGGGTVSVAALYYLLQAMIAPMATKEDLNRMEQRLSDHSIYIERVLGESSKGYVEAMSELGVEMHIHRESVADYMRDSRNREIDQKGTINFLRDKYK